jgi:hypothetical protein
MSQSTHARPFCVCTSEKFKKGLSPIHVSPHAPPQWLQMCPEASANPPRYAYALHNDMKEGCEWLVTPPAVSVVERVCGQQMRVTKLSRNPSPKSSVSRCTATETQHSGTEMGVVERLVVVAGGTTTSPQVYSDQYRRQLSPHDKKTSVWTLIPDLLAQQTALIQPTPSTGCTLKKIASGPKVLEVDTREKSGRSTHSHTPIPCP